MLSKIYRAVSSYLIVLGLILVGCAPAAAPTPTPKPAAPVAKPTPATPAPTAPAPTPKPAAEQPRYGGIITKGLYGDIGSFDAQREAGANEASVLLNIYQGLVRLHPIEHQKIVPELAEKWEVSPDGKTYTFKFYKGIKWHDGKPFTMEDVKYSLERMHNPKAFKTVSPRGEGLLTAMDKAEIVDQDTVNITTKYPSASFLLNIATGWVAIEPKHIIVAKGDMRKDAVATGAFKLKEYNPNISLELERNRDYYIKGLPYLDGIKFYVIKDDATRFSAFRTGKILVTISGSKGLSPTDAEIVKKEMADKALVYEHDAQTRHTIAFSSQRKPWNDVRVRKAVDLAFDRQAAIKVNANRGRVGSIFVSPWGMKTEDVEKLAGYRQPKDADLAEAKKLMAEAGYPDGFKTTMLSQPGGSREAQAVVAKAQLAKLGIEAELVMLEQAAVFERLGRRAFEAVAISWLDTTGDPDETLYTYYISGASRNYWDLSDKEVDELIEKQARTRDVNARHAILAEIEKRIMAQVPMVIVFWDFWQTGAWKEVKNFKPGPGIHPWGKFDQLWLAK